MENRLHRKQPNLIVAANLYSFSILMG